MTFEQFNEGLAYARKNFLEESATHLWIDKKIIRESFDLSGKNVLDFGCGMGGMTLWYARHWDCTVYGIDIDDHHIRVAEALREEFAMDNVTFFRKNVLEISAQEQYDAIFLNDVIEHIPPSMLELIMEKLSLLLKKNGAIYVSYPPWQGPYASHVNDVLKLPWCQFLPDHVIIALLKKHNKDIVGELEGSLLDVYQGLNKITHKKFSEIIGKTDLAFSYRMSHTLFNKFNKLKNVSLSGFPFRFLVTKEIVMLKKKA
ncbi:MAG: class I SAM-dependent methyltransferase [Cyclobacteriaceae bacterium]